MALALHSPLLALLSALPLAHSPGVAGPVAAPPLAVSAPDDGPIRFRSLRTEVRICEGVATTRAVILLENLGPRLEEVHWILPLGEGAVADDFRMRSGGVDLEGEVLDAQRAQGIYEDIVRSRKDPALLEHFGRGCLRARIFPVPPQSPVEVEVSWREILPEVGGLRRWTFPLAAAGIGTAQPERVALDLAIESSRALLNVVSTTPGLDVVRDGDHRARASFECARPTQAPRELTVLHALTDREFGLDVLSTRAAGDELGTFLMLLAPRRDLAASQSMPRTITFALDESGSMEGDKFRQARASVRLFLSLLRPGDEFNVVPFATEARPFFPAPVRAEPANVAEAQRRVGELSARGGTNVEAALRASLATLRVEPGRVPIVVLLSDGEPTVQERDPLELLDIGRSVNQAHARIFVLGVGHDLNATLLDRLAEDSGGTRTYVQPDADIELAARELFEALSHPVLTDLELAVEGAALERVVPSRLPDLFHGGRLIVAGRYRGAGPCKVRLTGTVDGERKQFEYEAELSDQPVAAFDFVPALYAERRVAALLDEIRLHGTNPELVDEIQRLGNEHNLVTPYTSHLLVERGLALPSATSFFSGAPGAPGVGGPASPGPSGPSAPGPAGPGTPMGGPAAATTSGVGALPIDTVAVLTQRLREAGVLPEGAPPEDLRALAQEIASEMRASSAGLQGLGRASSGQRAVEDSVWLERRLSRGVASVSTGSSEFFVGSGGSGTGRIAPADLLALFTCKVKDKTFVLRKGIWVQRELAEAEPPVERVVFEAYSQPWFDALNAQPALRPYFAFSARLVVEHAGTVYVVHPPPQAETEEPRSSARR